MRRLFSLLAAIFCLIALPVSAKDKPDFALVDELIRVAGMDVTFSATRNAIGNAPKDHPNMGSPDSETFLNAYKKSANSAFDPAVIRKLVRQALRKRLSDDVLQASIGFYSSQLGRRLVALEKEAQSHQMSLWVMKNRNELIRKLNDDPQRKQIMNSIMEGMSAMQMSETLVANLMYSTVAGMVGGGKLPPTLSDDQILAIVKSQMPRLRAELETTLSAAYYVTYQSVELAELSKYKDYLLSDSGRKTYTIFIQALVETLGNQARKFGAILLKELGIRSA